MAPNLPSGFLFLAPKKKNCRIAGYVAPGRLSLWLEMTSLCLLLSPPAFKTSLNPKSHSRGFDKGGGGTAKYIHVYSTPQRT